MCVCVYVCVLSHVQLFATLWTGEMLHHWNHAGMIGDGYTVAGSEWGVFTVYTADGFFVDSLFDAPGVPGRGGPYVFGGEDFSGRIQAFPERGEVWAYNAGHAFRVKGFVPAAALSARATRPRSPAALGRAAPPPTPRARASLMRLPMRAERRPRLIPQQVSACARVAQVPVALRPGFPCPGISRPGGLGSGSPVAGSPYTQVARVQETFARVLMLR